MKKRVLSMLLALTMLVSLLPVSVGVEAAPTVVATEKAGSHTDAHKCEECGATFSAWTSNNSLPAEGHYFLTRDVTLTAERQVTGKLHLCLNGYVIKAASGKRIFNTKGDTATELVITDCTAYTDANGVYRAGALTGGQDKSAGGGVVFVRRLGVVKIYDGRLTGNSSTIAGGVVALQAKSGSIVGGKFYMYGGEMSNNTAIDGSGVYKKGGAIYTGSGTVVELENVTIRDNTAVAGGAIYTGATATPIKLTNCLLEGNVANGADGGGVLFAESSARVEMTNCTLKDNRADSGDASVKTAGGVAFLKGTAKLTLTGCTLTGNKAPYGGGAVVWAKEETGLTMTNCTVTDNQAKNAGGAIYAMDKLNLTVTGSTFTGNSCGSAGSVLYYQNYVQVSLKDTTITGNTSTSTSASGYSAAIYGLGGSSKLTIGGKMVIANNTIKSPNTADLNFNNATTDILYINELAEGSQVNFSTKASTNVKASDVVALNGTQTTPWNDEWVTFLDENGNMKQVGYENNEFVFVVGHKHNGCNDAGCTDHAENTYKAWKDSTSLPASGSWYLDTDVTVSKEVRLGGTLNLCLNGHTVTGQTASARIYSTTADAQHVLNISDCTAKTVDGVYTAGAITGSHNTNTGAGGGAIFLRKGSVLRLFDGIISNNSTVAGGGAIYANEASVEIHNGLLTGNKAQNAEGAWKSGGAIYLQSSQMTMYGGEISGNEANDGAGILLSGTSALDMRGGKITGNTAHKTAAGVNVATTTSKIKLSGNVQIVGNTLANGTASNLRLVDGTVVELGTIGSDTNVYVTATAFKPISGQTNDYTAYFHSDDARLAVIYRDGVLFLDASDTHKHCPCGGDGAEGCDHGQLIYAPWTDATSLPASGNWYLDKDVTVSKEVRLGGTLNLCLNGHTVTGQTASARIYSTTADAQHVLNISDCTAKTVDGVYTAGAITGSHNTNTGAGGGAIFLRKGSVLRLFDGIISNNSTVAGGGAIYANEATVEIHNGLLTGNKAQNAEGAWKSGGAIYLQSSQMTMYGGEISGNEANDGAGILLSGTSALDMRGGKITGNTAHKTAAGVNVATTTSKIKLSGNVQIVGNTLADGTASNLRLVDGTVMELGTIGSDTNVYVTATAFKPISGQTDDYTAYFHSDDSRLAVIYRDGVLFLDASDAHKHCPCGGDGAEGCDHSQLIYAPWTDSTSLPASGNWYLDTDVTVSKEVRLGGTLNLCLNGHTVTGQTASARIYSTTADAQHVLNISDRTAKTVDGVYTAGAITGSHNTNTGAGGGVIFLRKGGILRLFDGIISNNSTVAGGGAIYANEATVEIHNGLLTGNKAQNAEGAWKSGGAIYLQSSQMTMYGGEISGNEANDGAGILLSGTSTLDMRGGKITGNTAHKTAAGVNVATTTSKIKLSGNVQIVGNTLADGTASNLRLVDGTVMELGKLSQTASVGITASAFRYISNETADCAARFPSDSADKKVIHQDGKLYVDVITDHKHCLCGGSTEKGCDHSKLNFAPWSDPNKLPSFGNYYLTVDVTVAARVNLENAELNLCLNGHSITVGEKGGRVFRMYPSAYLSLTDCTDKPGKITGATQGAILSDQDGKDMIINIWHITFTGNHAKSAGGVIIAQGDTTVNMYSGRIVDNSSVGYLKLDENGKPVLNEKGDETYVSGYGGGVLIIGGTFHMYGGEISGNKTEAVSYTKADGTKANGGGYGGGLYVRGTANLYGGVIKDNQAHVGGGVYTTGESSVVNLLGTEVSGNSAVSGGGMILQGKADAVMTEGVISANRATDSGAGIYVSAGSVLELKGGKIDSNQADKNGGGVALSGKKAHVTVDGCQISNNKAKNAGGIYSQTYAEVELKNGKVQNNYASASGGGIYNATNATFIMSGGSVEGNTTDGDVGGVMCLRGTAEITGGTISNNRGANTGGLKIYGTNANISNLSIVGNRAIGKPTVNEATGKTTYTGGSGCGLMVSATSYTKDGVKTDYIPVVNIDSIYVSGNHANGSAAGILVQSKGVVFNLRNATITNNEAASGAGGGMYIASNVKATLKNVTVTNNKANTAGGINFYGCTVDVDGLRMHDNVSVKGGAGMTIVAKTAQVNVRNAEIYNNTAGGAGGGLVVQTSATMHMEDSKIYGNTTTSLGGGIYFSAPSTGSLKNVEIFENRAERDGGGMNVYANCTVTLDKVTVRDNESVTVGGGIYTRGRLEATGCKILNNKAVDGGGIYTFKSAGDILQDNAGAFVNDTVISGNEALNQGGGVYNHRGGPIYLSGCMITDNKAAQQGSAVYADGRLGLDHVTVTGNASANNGYAVYVTSAEYDGHTYIAGHKKLSGELIVKDNQGGDMFLSEGAIVTVTGEQLGEKTHVAVTIPSGVLRQYVQGVYGYEGGDLHYVITAGSRSLTDPEALPVQPEQTEPEHTPATETPDTEATAPETEGQDNTVLYAGIGGIGAVIVLAAILVVVKKKKAGKATKE